MEKGLKLVSVLWVTVATGLCQFKVAAPQNGSKFSLDTGTPPSVQVPIEAMVGNQDAPATWNFQFGYKTRGSFSFTGPSRLANSVFNLKTRFTVYSEGGQVNGTASSTQNKGQSKTTFYIDGQNPPAGVIANRLISAYAAIMPSGGTQRLMIGLAQKESTFQQFASFKHPTYQLAGTWPNDNASAPGGAGGHVGLLQVSTAMDTAFDWTANISASASLLSVKLASARSVMNSYRSRYPRLPVLSGAQLEDDAVIYYGPYGSIGAYWVPNGAGNAWVKNSGNPNGVAYVDAVKNGVNSH